jgi:hypothetical protein
MESHEVIGTLWGASSTAVGCHSTMRQRPNSAIVRRIGIFIALALSALTACAAPPEVDAPRSSVAGSRFLCVRTSEPGDTDVRARGLPHT